MKFLEVVANIVYDSYPDPVIADKFIDFITDIDEEDVIITLSTLYSEISLFDYFNADILPSDFDFTPKQRDEKDLELSEFLDEIFSNILIKTKIHEELGVTKEEIFQATEILKEDILNHHDTPSYLAMIAPISLTLLSYLVLNEEEAYDMEY